LVGRHGAMKPGGVNGVAHEARAAPEPDQFGRGNTADKADRACGFLAILSAEKCGPW